MRKILSLILLAAGIWGNAQSIKKVYPNIDIPFKKFVLPNGLTIIIHEDHKAPIAAFNVWYHVGSKNEKPGKTGFAHLFEHLMFNGSENYNKDYFQLMDAIGATDLNGTTNNDRTNYFENFPVEALDKVLWVESDRMGYLLGAIDTAKLNEQRGVVQNEKRQGENEPYSIAEELTVKSTYPTGHPYSWTVIGSMEDLNAASLDDVKEWFKTYYGPNNATIVIAGDVNTEEVLEKVKKYFGAIPATPPIAKHTSWPSKLSGTHFQVAQDRVPQSRLQKTWNTEGWGTQQMTHLNLLADILARGKTSRLYKRLVYDDQLASNVQVYTDEKEIGGQFYIITDAKPGVELSKINAVINEELKKITSKGITATELERAKTTAFAGFVKGMERIGGFGGKSDILAQNQVFGGSPDYYKKVYKWIEDASIADLQKAVNDALTDGEYVLEIHPYGTYKATDNIVNRKEEPALGKPSPIKFPAVQEFTLANGLKVALVERKSVPVVNMSLMLNAGYAADQFGVPGLAKLSLQMLREGTQKRSALQISDQLSDLGATLGANSDLDNSYISLNALKSNFDASLELFADVVLNPVFPQANFERVQKERLLGIKQEQSQPVSMGLRVLPKLLYGSNHAYSNPFTGSGYESTVSKIKRADLVKFYSTWFAPNNATLVVVGDVDANELKAKLEKQFAGWKQQSIPTKNIADVALPASPKVYLIDKPGALQSIIFAAVISPSAKDADYEYIQMMNKVLGGEFTSRINMNLREDKHWSYGAFSINLEAKGPSFFTAYAPVQTDKTKESVNEVLQELNGMISNKPPTEQEFAKFRQNAILQLPGTWETNGAVLNSLQSAIKYNRGVSYLNGYASLLQNMQLSNINDAAKKVIKPGQLTWVIVGDRAKIEKGLQELNIGNIQYIDSEGNQAK